MLAAALGVIIAVLSPRVMLPLVVGAKSSESSETESTEEAHDDRQLKEPFGESADLSNAPQESSVRRKEPYGRGIPGARKRIFEQD